MGVRGLRGCVRVQHAPVHAYEAVRDAGCAAGGSCGLRRGGDPSHAQGAKAEDACRRPQDGGRRGRGDGAQQSGRGNGRREGRHRRRDHRHSLVEQATAPSPQDISGSFKRNYGVKLKRAADDGSRGICARCLLVGVNGHRFPWFRKSEDNPSKL